MHFLHVYNSSTYRKPIHSLLLLSFKTFSTALCIQCITVLYLLNVPKNSFIILTNSRNPYPSRYKDQRTLLFFIKLLYPSIQYCLFLITILASIPLLTFHNPFTSIKHLAKILPSRKFQILCSCHTSCLSIYQFPFLPHIKFFLIEIDGDHQDMID